MIKNSSKKIYKKPALEVHGNLKAITNFGDFGGTDDDGGGSHL